MASPAFAEQLIWGVQAEQLEYRIGDETDVVAWDVDAQIGTDELKLVFRSEGEFETTGDVSRRRLTSGADLSITSINVCRSADITSSLGGMFTFSENVVV